MGVEGLWHGKCWLQRYATANRGFQHANGGVLHLRSNGQAPGRAAQLHASVLQQTLDVKGGAVSLDGRVQRQDDFSDVTGADPADERIDGQVVRLDAFEGSDVAKKNMIDAANQARLLECDQVLRLLDYPYLAMVALGIGTNPARIRLGEVKADAAMSDLVFYVEDGRGEVGGESPRLTKDVKSQALGAAGSDSRELAELLFQASQRFDGFGRHKSSQRFPSRHCWNPGRRFLSTQGSELQSRRSLAGAALFQAVRLATASHGTDRHGSKLKLSSFREIGLIQAAKVHRPAGRIPACRNRE